MMSDKEWICNAAKNLHQDQYLELLRIITLNNTKFTENNNGIFIDLDQTSNTCIQKIMKYLKYSQENKVCTSSNNQKQNIPCTNPQIETTNRKNILSAGISPDELDYQESDISNFASCSVEDTIDDNRDVVDVGDDFELNEPTSDDEV